MNPKLKYFIKEWVEPIVVAVVLALIIRAFVVQAFKIPTGSMKPTLLENDRIFVNKFIYRFKEPKIGDIVVFKYPENPKKDFVKRFIAEGGETVQIKRGDVFIDGKLVKDPEIIKSIYYYNKGPYGSEGKKTFVPEGFFYALGDNSKSSRDSRYWGFVPEKNLIGKAFLIYWPPKRIRTIKYESSK